MKLRPTTTKSRPRPSLIDRMARDGRRLRDIKPTPGDNGDQYDEDHHPNTALRRSFTAFTALVDQQLDRANIPDADIEAIRLGLGMGPSSPLPSEMLAGNRHVRLKAYRLLYDALRREWRGRGGKPGKFVFGTIVTDMGNSLEYEPVIELERLRRDFRKTIALTGLNSIAFIETQAGMNYPQAGFGRTLMTHCHFIGFTDDPEYDVAAAERAARTAPLYNWLGAPTVKLAEITSRGELRRYCSYVTKLPVSGGRLVRDDWKASGYRIDPCNVDGPMALRLAELLLTLQYRDTVFITGKSVVPIKRDMLRGLVAWHARRRVDDEPDYDAIFERLWRDGRFGRPRAPFDIRWDTSQPLSSAWWLEMDNHRQEVLANREAHRKREQDRRDAEALSAEMHGGAWDDV